MEEKKRDIAPPSIVWVLGTATNVGKTTVASCLIRLLNAANIAALGFKPYVGGRFRDLIDFSKEHYRRVPCRVFGDDGLKLARASPLTSDADVDLVTPWQLLFWRSSDDTLFIRTGSACLDNYQFFKSPLTDRLMERPDIQQAARTMNIPVDDLQLFNPSVTERSSLAPGAPGAAFQTLMLRKPSAVVVEAAGPFLPTWDGSPNVNHVVLVSDENLVLYPNVNMTVHANPSKPRGYTQHLLQALDAKNRENISVPHLLVESSVRSESTQTSLRELLYRTGIY